MADEACSNAPRTIHSPKIIFIRLGKDKSKDFIQGEVLKQIRKALRKSSYFETDQAKDKNCVTLSDLDAREIREVAIGPKFIGVLFKDGRVCRVKCISSNPPSSEKPSKPKSSTNDAIFQVQSDEVYARRLQEQLKHQSPSGFGFIGPNSPVVGPTSPSLSDVATSGVIFGGQSPQLFAESSGDSSTTPEVWRTASFRSDGAQRRSLLSERPRSPSGDAQARGGDESIEPKAKTAGTSGGSPFSGNQTTAKSSSSSTTSARTVPTTNPEPRNQNNSQSSVTSMQEPRNNHQSYGELNRSIQTSIALVPRRATSSPTLFQRTLYTTEFPMLRMVRPMMFPPNVLIPQGVIPVSSFDVRRFRDPLGSRSRAYQPSHGRAQFPGTSSGHRNGSHGNARSENASTEGNLTEFCYPQSEKIEWLETKSVSTVGTVLLFANISFGLLKN